MYKKTLIILAIISLFAPGVLPYRFIDNKETVNKNLVAHAELCCCGNIASECSNCCCSDDHTGDDNTNRNTVTITACGGTPDDIINISRLNYLSSHASFIKYISVTTVAEKPTLRFNDVLRRQPYKPPKQQLLSNLI